MSLIELFFLAFSLSLDCFAISISQGIKVNENKKPIIILAILFGLFQYGMFVFGYFFGSYLLSFFSSFANWIAVILLLYIGIKMIKEGFEEEEEAADIGNVKDYLVLSVATSIDAFAAGISFISIKTNFVFTSAMVGFTSLGMGLIGGLLGKKIGEKFGKHAEVAGGFILIGLALKAFLYK